MDFTPKNPTIKIDKDGINAELLGQAPNEVKKLFVYSCVKSAELSLLADYPNVEKLTLIGEFANVDDVSSLKSLAVKLEYLGLEDMRKLSEISFVEELKGLKKLYLKSLPAIEKLPDFGKMPSLYGLKIYELHKLNDIESLARSSIRYLDLTLAADKLSGTKIADVLLRMERLERFSGKLDRSHKRDDVLENKLIKSGKSDILNYFDMDEWLTL